MTDPAEVVRTFFMRRHVAGLVLPDGWFGRPYDNQFALDHAIVEDDLLTIVLDTGHAIVISTDAVVRDTGGSLLITAFDLATFVNQTTGRRAYRDGAIEFVGVGARRAEPTASDDE